MVIAAVGLAVMVGVVVLIATRLGRVDPGEASEARAQVLCQSAVRERLVSPATMAVAGRPILTQSPEGWLVEVQVDSQNAFGALIRSDWACLVEGDRLMNVAQLR